MTGATPGGMLDTTLLEFFVRVVCAFVPVAVVCVNDREPVEALTLLVAEEEGTLLADVVPVGVLS